MNRRDDGVRYLMVRAGTRRAINDRGRLRFTGDYWQGRASASWGPLATAHYYTREERDLNPNWAERCGGEWVEVLVNIDPA